jgi:hypothetical protein
MLLLIARVNSFKTIIRMEFITFYWQVSRLKKRIEAKALRASDDLRRLLAHHILFRKLHVPTLDEELVSMLKDMSVNSETDIFPELEGREESKTIEDYETVEEYKTVEAYENVEEYETVQEYRAMFDTVEFTHLTPSEPLISLS